MPKALSLFSGGGGLDLGFAAAGYQIICATDKDDFSCKTLRQNAGKRDFYLTHPVIEADITQTTGAGLLESAKASGRVEIIFGGPPCQAFSVFGRRKGLADARGNLIWEFVRIVKELEPQAFLFENVAGLKTIHGGCLYSDLIGRRN